MKKEEFIKYCKEQGYNLTDDQFSGGEKIEGNLYLKHLTSIPEGFSPVVGGSLYLNSLTSIPKGFNPKVGGYLGLGGLTSIPEGFNPVVGYNLWLDSLTEIPENFNPLIKGDIYIIDDDVNIKPILEFINFHI